MWITHLLLILLAVSITAVALWVSLKPTHIDSNPMTGPSNTSAIKPAPPVIPNTPAAAPELPASPPAPSVIPTTPAAAPELPAPPVVTTTPAAAPQTLPGAPHKTDTIGYIASPGGFSPPAAISTPIVGAERPISSEKLGLPIPFDLN